jgi:2-hydroxycyclohexanecarboxyl-CoA dehydrogenase
MSPVVPQLDGKVALVTGGGSGIGEAICHAFAEAGATVIVNDLHELAACRVTDDLRARGATAVAAPFNVTDAAAIESQLGRLALGEVDVLCNNAGIAAPRSPFTESDPAGWRRELDVILLGMLRCTHAVLPGMVAQRRGAIVNIASDGAKLGEAGFAVYSGVKAAVLGFTRSLASEVASAGVRVNCVCPGLTRTPLVQESGVDVRRQQAMVSRFPIARLGEPREQALAVTFLASEAAGWITGQVLSVAGGATMQP